MLRTLVYMHEPVGLRQVARIAGVHPHTAELVLADLVQEGMATRCRTASRSLFALVRGRDDVAVLEAVFKAADEMAAKLRSKRLSVRAVGILPFIQDATRLIRKAKESRHVA